MRKFLFASMMVGALSMGLGLVGPKDAAACGGCFHIQQGGDVGQVTGHRMIFSVSQQQTTLWDQISYAGSPESFAWVLPIHGQVDVGVSSDALFGMITEDTKTAVYSPSIDCPQCSNTTTFTTTGGGGTGGSGGGVTVIAQETVGPYETVQLSSQDPTALQTWLSSHGYAIPADVQPIITQYVSEGFDFLAMKLVPGQGVDSMQPVRVTTPGAGLTLPLRMVTAGTGVTTPITLWVFADGRYQPTNFPNFEIKPDEVTWDWDTMSSDYSVLVQQKIAATQGKGWLLEASFLTSTYSISQPLLDAAEVDPAASGYGADAATALPAAQADMDALLGNIGQGDGTFTLTRIHAELPHAALATDLTLGASADQSAVYPYIVAGKTKGTPPMCPPIDCGGSGGGTTTGSGTGGAGAGFTGTGAANGETGAGASKDASATGGGCAVGGEGSGFAAILTVLGLTALLMRKRRES
ncbi:MAG: DUF2330 domain-containing protein [Polyangiaceae bacterium]